MSDQDRIHALVAEGKITEEEAQRLLAALREADDFEATDDLEAEVDTEVDAGIDTRLDSEVGSRLDARFPSTGAFQPPSAEAARAVPQPTVPPSPPEPVAPPRAGYASPGPVGGGRGFAEVLEGATFPVEPPEDAPSDLRWVHISLLAGDLEIRVDETLAEPQVENDRGNLRLSREGEHYRVFALKRKKPKLERGGVDGLLDGISDFVSGIVGRVGDVSLRVPKGFGVVLESKSGDVEVHGLPFLKAQLLAGDLDLHGVGGCDLTMSAGDVDAALLLTSGVHRIKLSAGDVDVRLLEGSSVQVTGSLSMGDLDARPPFEAARSGMGASLSGTVGGGAAQLEILVSAGDVDVRYG